MYTKQQIIEEIKKIAMKLGVKSLKKMEFTRNAKMSLSTVRYHFSSWNEAVKEAGLIPIESGPIKHAEKIDDEKLLLDLVRIYKEYGKEPTESLINAKGEYSTRPYVARWKTVKNALLMAKKKFPN